MGCGKVILRLILTIRIPHGSVECSVSGSFFMDYPLVEGIIGPESDRSAAWCTDAVLTKVDTLVMRSPEYNLVITRYAT